ncbi:DUF1600 domain-containing protein [Mesomycoplasma moatsii]|uniref:DUF1600 domain-containing protein n=1 Tax=Mesomycoplasma moatsii TaxID=171287 RepID=UPI0003B384E8
MKQKTQSITLIKKLYFLLFLICFVSVVLFIYRIITSLEINTPNKNPWKTLDKFTWESNMLISLYTFFYVFKPKYSFMKNDSFFLSVLTYITFTFIGYNVILNTSSLGYAFLKNYNLFESIWVHAICPSLFIALGIFKIFRENNLKILSLDLKNSLFLMMIYVVVYCLYLIIIPYIYNTHDETTYSVYGKFTNTKDYPQLAYPIIIGVCFVFFPSVYIGYFQLQKYVISKNKF